MRLTSCKLGTDQYGFSKADNRHLEPLLIYSKSATNGIQILNNTSTVEMNVLVSPAFC